MFSKNLSNFENNPKNLKKPTTKKNQELRNSKKNLKNQKLKKNLKKIPKKMNKKNPKNLFVLNVQENPKS